jgi:dihydroorotase
MKIACASGVTPFDAIETVGWAIPALVRGRLSMRDGELIGSPSGRVARFEEAIPLG